MPRGAGPSQAEAGGAGRRGGGFHSGVDSRRKCGIIKVERALPVSGQPSSSFLRIVFGNRHLAEWRFLLFTMIVTVKGPICNVIRMASPPFRGCG